MPESQQQNTPQKPESNGNSSPESDVSTDSKVTPPESQSPLHWLADLAEQKAREEKKGKPSLLSNNCNQQCSIIHKHATVHLERFTFVFCSHCGLGFNICLFLLGTQLPVILSKLVTESSVDERINKATRAIDL